MKEKIYLRRVVEAVTFVGLILLISSLLASTLTQAKSPDDSMTVIINENGFTPSDITVEVGTTVIWTNETQQIVHLKSGDPHHLYLPLLQRNASTAQVYSSASPMRSVGVAQTQNNWADIDLNPGQSYSHLFSEVGNYAYYLATQPDKVGLVRVVEPALDFALDISPNSQAVIQGQSVAFSITLTETTTPTLPVALSVAGLPNYVTANFDPPTTTAASTLTLSTTLDTSAGIYNISILGASAGVTRTAPLTLTVASAAFAPTTDPSGIMLHLDQVVYEDGDKLTVVLEFGDIVPPDAVGEVFVASPGTADVEVVSLQNAGGGRFTSAEPIPLTAQAGVSTPADGTLALVPGETFAALYYIDRSHPSLAGVDEDIVAAIGLFAGGDTSSTPVSIIPDLALTEDERTPPTGAKPTGTLLTDGGLPVQIATAEVILFPRSDDELTRFLAETGGEILDTQDGDETTLPAVLIALETSNAPTAHLAQLRAVFGEEGALFASNSAVLDMYAFLLAYQIDGYIVAANPRLQYQGAPALQEPEASAVSYTMQMVPARTSTGPCVPGDAARPCVNNVPAVWAYTTLWGADTHRINLAVLDMGFATNDDFRPPSTGDMVECRINAFGTPNCGPGLAQGSPTVGNSFFGGRSWHGTGVVTTAAGVMNNGFGAAGVGGQVAVPMLYKYDTFSYAFEIGSGIRKAVNDGAACINISAGYPCRILTNIGPDFNICTVGGRAGLCAVATATVHAAAAVTCVATAWIPIAGQIICTAAISGAVAATAACFSTLAFGDLAGPMQSAVHFAADRGVPVVTIAGNAFQAESLPPVIRDLVDDGNRRTEDWGLIPAMAPEAIVVGAVDRNFDNVEFFGNRVDIWAPIYSAYFAPNDVNDPSSPVGSDTIGGTSAAAPFVAGLITVMQAINPDLNPHTPGMSNIARSAIVPRIRAILTDDEINFTNADLVSLGYSDQPVERRRLINPLAAVQAATAGAVPDLDALGYDTSLNFSELLFPNDTQAQALPLPLEETVTGSLIELPEPSILPIDDDWFSLSMPAAPANRIYETTVTLRYLSDSGGAGLVGDNVSWLSGGGSSPERITTYRLLAAPSAPALVNVTGQKSVYKLTTTTPQLAVPVVTITQPASAAELCEGTVSFAATASYSGATTLSVPASAFAWSISGVGPIGTGMTAARNLTPGSYTVTVTLFGDATIADARNLTIIDCTGAAPTATIITPATDSGNYDSVYSYDGHDDALGLWYTDVALTGTATDLEDGTLTGAALAWTTNRTDIHASAQLGIGTSLTVRLYSNDCSGVWHEVTLIATDSNGNPSQPVTRRIRIWTVCQASS